LKVPTAKAARKPNILIIMADQLGAPFLPAYGNRIVKTPHLDALAEQGVVFSNAYCNSPLCGPSRYVFMSGRMPSAIGAYDNAVEFPASLPTFAHYLRNAGYRTILSGKMHFCGPDQMHGFEERLTTDIYPADFGWTPDWTDFNTRPDWYHDMSSVRDAGLCVRTNQMDFDDEVIFNARRKLFDMARQEDERPFCLVVSLTHPHDPFAMTAEYWNRYKPNEINMPRISATPADPHSQRLRYVCNMDNEPVSDDNIRDARHAYYAAISYVDDQVGLLLDTMRQCGLMDETVIIVTADHGEMLGEHGLWYKMNFFENASRIPLIVHAPNRFLPMVVTACVSSVDVLPTLVDIAHDGKAPDYEVRVDGVSLLPHLAGMNGLDNVFGEYMGEGAIAPLVMIRRGAYKFIHSAADPDQLFNLDADPDEAVNLTRLPEHASIAADFREEVDRRWNLRALHEDVLASQRRRRFINNALRCGAYKHWDFQPVTDASAQYMRNHLKLGDLESRARFPKITRN
jgi:choline-sulfatase